MQIKNISLALVISSALGAVLGAMTLLSAQSPQRFTTELSQDSCDVNPEEMPSVQLDKQA